MTQAKPDRSQEALNNLNNKVDQKRLAFENKFLRWLVVFFAVALVLTLIFYPHLPKEDKAHEVDAQALRDYSGTVSQQFPSEFVVRAVSHAGFNQMPTAPMYRF
jgi:hypothetical protein